MNEQKIRPSNRDEEWQRLGSRYRRTDQAHVEDLLYPVQAFSALLQKPDALMTLSKAENEGRNLWSGVFHNLQELERHIGDELPAPSLPRSPTPHLLK